MKLNTTAVRGCKDILPNEMELREKVLNIIKRTYTNNGFNLVKTPILESLDWLNHGDEGENTKLMYKTIKRGADLDLTKQNLSESDLTAEGLKYDQTVPLVRLWCGNREKLTFPFKSIQCDESFRAERPQRGRYRQFTQIDADIIGDDSINAEIDIILTALQSYKNVGLNNIEARISDRRILNGLIQFAGFKDADCVDIAISLDKFDKIGNKGVIDELVAKGYPHNKIVKLVDTISNIKTEGVKALSGMVDDTLIQNMLQIVKAINSNAPKSMSAIFDITIVRGQGYYTGTVFEFYTKEYDYHGALGGGGRYDNMSYKFIGENVPMIGFGLGLEPTLMLIAEHKLLSIDTKKLAILYTTEDSNTLFKYKHQLQSKYDVAIFTKNKNLRAQLEKLKDNGYIGWTDISTKEIKIFD